MVETTGITEATLASMSSKLVGISKTWLMDGSLVTLSYHGKRKGWTPGGGVYFTVKDSPGVFATPYKSSHAAAAVWAINAIGASIGNVALATGRGVEIANLLPEYSALMR